MDQILSAPHIPWLIRISEVFESFLPEILEDLGAGQSKKLGTEYYLVNLADPARMRDLNRTKFLRWKIPVDHAWPCNPEKMEGFVEKAAQTLARKFAPSNPQAVFMGLLDPSATKRYYKTLASNLRGRSLQLFSKEVAEFSEIESQDVTRETLFCMVGKEGIYAGMLSPRAANGFFPGGTKFISQNSPDTISRAGAKIAEALHYLRLHHVAVKKGGHWLELGASPGGMTSELLMRGYQVTAIDRAPLDKRLDQAEGLHFAKMDVSSFKPNSRMNYDAIVCDMNGESLESLGQVIRLSQNLKPGGLVVFTLKTAGITTYRDLNQLHKTAVTAAADSSLDWLATTHLTYNRNELTLFFKRFEGEMKTPPA